MNPINTGALSFALGDIRGRRGGGQVEFVVLARVGDDGPHAILRDLDLLLDELLLPVR